MLVSNTKRALYSGRGVVLYCRKKKAGRGGTRPGALSSAREDKERRYTYIYVHMTAASSCFTCWLSELILWLLLLLQLPLLLLCFLYKYCWYETKKNRGAFHFLCSSYVEFELHPEFGNLSLSPSLAGAESYEKRAGINKCTTEPGGLPVAPGLGTGSQLRGRRRFAKRI